MITPPHGGRDPSPLADLSTLDATYPMDEWITVVEFQADRGEPFVVDDVKALMGQLRIWQPSGLWSADRHAIQLKIPAPTAPQALQWALAYYRQAAIAVGLAMTTLVRIEVLTVEEHDRSSHQYDLGAPLEVPALRGLLCDEVYAATRRLLAATTPGDLDDVLVRFVISVGGRVERGEPRHLPGITEIDLSVEGDQTQHATADAFSVAGLIIDQSLPTLLIDARQALARLRAQQRCGPTQTISSSDPAHP